jgi:protein-disulfide isomerase
MKRVKKLVVLIFLMVPLLIAGCVDKKKIEGMEQTQKDILAKLDAIEKNQKDMLKVFNKGKRPQIDFNKVHKIPLASSKIRGNPAAPVTVVEFSDFQCPYCSKLQPTLKEVLKAYPNDVKLIYKDFPLSFHKQAKNAAKAAHAAGEQGKYWEMHDLIFEKYNKLTDALFTEFAGKLQLDMTKFAADYKSNKYDKQIQEDINLGRRVGVSGTPTLFMNGKRMRNRSVSDFKTAIDGYLKKKK